MATGGEGSSLFHSVLHHNSKSVNVFITPKTFYWCSEGSEEHPYGNVPPRHSIPLTEIFAVSPNKQVTSQNEDGDIEMSMLKSTSFIIHAIKRMKHHKWKTKRLLFDCQLSSECYEWIQRIQELLDGMQRPRRLLIFINPVGGKKLAGKIYKEKVQPLFDLANIKTEIIVTERANHAKDYLELESLDKLDGIITVGGDGMFHEILNGLIRRTQTDNNVDTTKPDFEPVQPSLTVGVIPAGSTDAIAYCTNGINDPVTSALHIIIGDVHPLDVCSVKHKTEVQRYSVSMAAYGFFGDVLQDSEKLRWMGPKRYDYSGFKKFFINKGYDGSVSFLQDDSLEAHPLDKSRCRTGCYICNPVNKDPFLQETPDETDKQTESDSSSLQWKTIDGRFISVIGVNMSCACAKSPEGLSPSAHLADGYMDLILVKHTSRLQYLRHMLSLANRSNHFNFNFVEVFRVKEFHFKPSQSAEPNDDETDEAAIPARDNDQEILAGPAKKSRGNASKSTWNVDGEPVEEPGVHVRVHCQLIKIFARGIEECSDTPSCALCYRR
ncbi:ceramide kinase-like [Actinia tenebrosa]|uniref:Ceramide kinase-like n=1 Tax=Actinia tenebrosa TaxID=6105 RepID=A0A6P8H4Z7_ACTTE|nr:ceramide kinase-like [Actinia tenebrosa]